MMYNLYVLSDSHNSTPGSADCALGNTLRNFSHFVMQRINGLNTNLQNMEFRNHDALHHLSSQFHKIFVPM